MSEGSMMAPGGGATDLLALFSADYGGVSRDPSRPDYAMPAYHEAAPRWQLVSDIRTGTLALREKAAWYLPRFEAEEPSDWLARVRMTFVNEHYADTLQERIGLLTAIPPKVEKDVPTALQPLLEDIDGQGNHLEVFTPQVLDAAMHLGHAVLFTDYPSTAGIATKRDATAAKVRPYVTLYRACDVLSARYAVVGGVQCLIQITFRQTTEETEGTYGVKTCIRYLTVRQEVIMRPGASPGVEIPSGLGKITFIVEEKGTDDVFTKVDEGEIVGPKMIPARVVYGGEKLGPLQSRPHLWGLALSNIEETQVTSDYAAVMHKCNVPTAVFIGRQVDPGEKKTVQMGQGIDVPVGGDAKFMEPSGAALAATRQRLEDIRAVMRRSGATSDETAGKVMTAEEARLHAAKRNAKLTQVARSLQDALEGVLQDMAAYLQLPSGGSILINHDFSGTGIDMAYLQVLVSAYRENALTLESLLVALKTGKLPEEFSPESEAMTLIAEEIERQDRMAEQMRQQQPPAGRPGQPPVPAPVT